MTMTPHTLQTESPVDELAMLLVGDKKAGKSWLAATAPGNVFFMDFDQRLSALRSHPNAKNIYGLTFADDTNPNMMPTAFNEMLEVLGKFEKSPFLKDVHRSFASANDKMIDTIVFDSVQTISDSARRFVLYNGGEGEGGLAKGFKIGGRMYRVAKSFHAWGGEMEMVTGAILAARALLHCKTCHKSITFVKDSEGVGIISHTDKITKFDHEPTPRAMNVIAILHEAAEQDERSTLENPIYTGKIEVFPRRYHTLLVYFNEVWRLVRETGRVPKIYCDPDGKFTQAATALGIQSIKEPDITTILKEAKLLQRK
jgi:hypothetical protein